MNVRIEQKLFSFLSSQWPSLDLPSNIYMGLPILIPLLGSHFYQLLLLSSMILEDLEIYCHRDESNNSFFVKNSNRILVFFNFGLSYATTFLLNNRGPKKLENVMSKIEMSKPKLKKFK